MHHDGVVLDSGVHYVVVAALALAGEDRREVAGRDVLQVAHPDIGELAVVVDVDRHQPRALAARRIVVIAAPRSPPIAPAPPTSPSLPPSCPDTPPTAPSSSEALRVGTGCVST